MYLSPLQLSSNSQILMSGDVVVNEGAAIAPGVIMQAEPGSRISIAAGACIGLGVILHAREGTLEIEAGVILGAGVLVVGAGKIGANACIGAGTTLIDPCIDQMQIMPAGSLIGDTSRQAVRRSNRSSANSSANITRNPRSHYATCRSTDRAAFPPPNTASNGAGDCCRTAGIDRRRAAPTRGDANYSVRPSSHQSAAGDAVSAPASF
jgi:carbonic anhydrase/acetyltransferase-like protein (isoleucine patch superfamily)